MKTKIEERFWDFHRANRHVFRAFSDFALQAIEKGRGQFGSKAVFERLRWYTRFETADGAEPWKLSNDFTPYYARLFMKKHPEHEGFFKTRKLRSKARQDYDFG